MRKARGAPGSGRKARTARPIVARPNAARPNAARAERPARSAGSARPARPYHHGDLANALIHAAATVVDLHGLEALTLREAARRAGVSHNAPYRHFADRAALTAAVAADGFLMLIEDLDAAAAARGSETTALARAYLNFAKDNPGRFALMFCAEAHAAKSPALADASAALADTLARHLGAARAPALWAAMHGAALLHGGGLLDAEAALAGLTASSA